jgi:hypothetical protein
MLPTAAGQLTRLVPVFVLADSGGSHSVHFSGGMRSHATYPRKRPCKGDFSK